MSFFSRLASAFTAEEKKIEPLIDHGWTGSSRFLIIPAFALFLFYGHTIFSIWTILILAGLAAIYMVTNTWSKVATINANRDIIVAREHPGHLETMADKAVLGDDGKPVVPAP